MVEVVDSRRLTGPNLYGVEPGAVLELRFASVDGPADPDADALIDRWRAAARAGLERLGWPSTIHVRRFCSAAGVEGVELMFTAPVDQLYAATELNEWALDQARQGGPEVPTSSLTETGAETGAETEAETGAETRLEAVVEAARLEAGARRGALALIEAAEARGIPWLLDDDELSLAYFAGSMRWPVGALPEPDAVPWSRLPSRAEAGAVALITGTNGKTTTTRMLARIARKGGRHVGNTSTDGLYVDGALVEAGDWTGPGGARAVLRDPRVDLALLEAARGGLLRRGAGVRSCRVAVITNVARDHLGEYGIHDLAGMAAAKGIVATIVEPGGRVVLGADSPAVCEWAAGRTLPAPVVWVSLDPEHPMLVEARAAGAETWTLDGEGWLCRDEGAARTRLCPGADLPTSLGGLALHNLANALAAGAAARGLGLGDAAIVAGLREFGAEAGDNPGRARTWRLPHPGGGHVDLLLDFAHNLAGFEAIAGIVRRLGCRPVLSFGMAGDRSDAELAAHAEALLRFSPRRVIVRDQGGYLRGRSLGEVPGVLRVALVEAGFGADLIDTVGTEAESLQRALERSEPGELIVLLAHTERDDVDAWLEQHGALSSPLRPPA